jgi:drug/metabolite transporter (DMT)-like permease
MSEQNARLGIFLMIVTTFVFAMQDGISRYLAGEYNVLMVVMIRYWFFAAFVIAIASRSKGGIARAARTEQPWLQAGRGVLLALEICVMVLAFTLLGLVESHAVFTCYPLLIAALSGPILGERVGWRRWTAIGVGFVGVLVILQPGFRVFEVEALIPLTSAFMFALYGLLTRYAARKDRTETSFFWTGTVGAVVMTAIGVWFWEPMAAGDWLWMALLVRHRGGGALAPDQDLRRGGGEPGAALRLFPAGLRRRARPRRLRRDAGMERGAGCRDRRGGGDLHALARAGDGTLAQQPFAQADLRAGSPVSCAS